jgi:hypothetical protein
VGGEGCKTIPGWCPLKNQPSLTSGLLRDARQLTVSSMCLRYRLAILLTFKTVAEIFQYDITTNRFGPVAVSKGRVKVRYVSRLTSAHQHVRSTRPPFCPDVQKNTRLRRSAAATVAWGGQPVLTSAHDLGDVAARISISLLPS